MDRFEKFLQKINPKLRAKVHAASLAILAGRLKGLDIKPLTGKKGWYRCRIRDVRIIFIRTGTGENAIVDIDFRGNIYKKR